MSTLLAFVFCLSVAAYWQLTTQSAIAHKQTNHTVNWLPFAEHFARSYDVAIAQIGIAIITYMLAGTAIMIAAIKRKLILRKRILLLLLAIFASLIQILLSITRGYALDITEPILAITSLLLILGIAQFGFYSIKSSCRRKNQVSVKHDRRQKPHIY